MKKIVFSLSLLIPLVLHVFDGQGWLYLSFLAWLIAIALPGLFLSAFGIPWTSAKPLGLFLIALPLYLVFNYFSVPYHSFLYWPLTVLALTLVWKKRHAISWQEVGQGELLFLAIFSIFLLSNAFHPILYWGEKPMDLSLLGSLLRFETGPLDDPWAAGSDIKYYLLGYFSWALPARAANMGLEQAYSYSIAGVAAMTALSAVGLYRALNVARVYLASAFFPFISTAGALVSFSQHPAFDTTFFWGATRVFRDKAFAEFPLWSFLFSDLHPHVMVYPLVLIVFSGIIRSLKQIPDNLTLISTSLALMILPFSNAWDFILLAPLAGLVLVRFGKIIWNKTFILCFSSIVLAALTAFWMTKTNSRATTFALSDSAGIAGFFTHFSLGIIAAGFFVWRQRLKALAWLLVVLLALILVVDHIIFMDRINTIFKFMTTLGVLFAVFIPAIIFCASTLKWRVVGGVIFSASILGTILLLISHWSALPYPVKVPSLKGMSFLKYALPSDAGVIEYLNQLPGRPRILEVPGKSFDYQSARISAYTGLPTWLGWDHHVVLRGKTWLEVRKRKTWVDGMYESTDAVMVYNQLREKKIEYVVVGPSEKGSYQSAGLSKFSQYPEFFSLILMNHHSELYQVLRP